MVTSASFSDINKDGWERFDSHRNATDYFINEKEDLKVPYSMGL